MTWPCWRLVLLLMGICFVAHFNRVSMAVAGDLRIMQDYDMTPTTMGWVYSAFLCAYTLFMIPGGWLIDRCGPRFSLQLVCFGSAVFVVFTGCVGWTAVTAAMAFPAFLAIRAFMGLISAPLHPAAAKAVSLGIPVVQRSAANGLITGAALLGIASTYLVFGFLIDHVGWPNAFVTAAVMTAIVAWMWGRYTTAEIAEHDTVTVTRPMPTNQSAAELPPRTVALSFVRRNKNLLLLTLSYAAVGYFQYLFFYWMHYYFETVLQLGEQDSRVYAAIPPLAMALGMPLGGWLSDRIQSLFGWRAARAGLAMIAMTASASLLWLGVQATEPFWIVTWMSLALGVLGTLEGPFWVTAFEVGGRRGGLSAAIFNTGGNGGGIIAPIATPWISDSLGYGWQAGITVGSLVCLGGAVLWFFIDDRETRHTETTTSATTTASLYTKPC